MSYRICWSLKAWHEKESGCVSALLNAYDDRMVEERDRRYGLFVQAERDPYISQLNELGYGVSVPKRRALPKRAA